MKTYGTSAKIFLILAMQILKKHKRKIVGENLMKIDIGKQGDALWKGEKLFLTSVSLSFVNHVSR